MHWQETQNPEVQEHQGEPGNRFGPPGHRHDEPEKCQGHHEEARFDQSFFNIIKQS